MTTRNAWVYIAGAYVVVVMSLLVARIAGLQDSDAIFSLGQLLVDALVLPVAVYGFIMAAEEFKKAQLRPDIDLHWEDEFEDMVKGIRVNIPQGGGAVALLPVLMNRGTVIGVWYRVTLTIPHELTYHWRSKLGGRDHWRPTYSKAGNIESFMSQGQFAVYPDERLSVGTLCLEFEAGREYSARYVIPYTIATDRGERKDGVLTLRLTRKPFQVSSEESQQQTD